MPNLANRTAPFQRFLGTGITTTILVAALTCPPALAAPKPASPLAPYAGFWAPNTEQCRDPNQQSHQRLHFDAEGGKVYDGRAPNVDCLLEKAKTYPNGLTANLICEIGQESPFSFRTDIAILRTGPRTLSLTNSFVDRKPETWSYVRCTTKDLQLAQQGAAGAPERVDSGPHYSLPPLREGEFYAGNAYPADYDERRTELLSDKAKALTRLTSEPCTHPFCKRYPEIRACYDGGAYCVGRWERSDGATVDYVVKPDDLTVLKTICRDTCGADEVRPQAR